MPIPQSILERIATFGRNLDSYLNPDYKEAQVRQEFIDPLFAALGWDVRNDQGYAEAYKDVVHEDSLRIAGVGVKAPDYSFRIGGTRKFFVEAKKPSVYLKDSPEPAHQLRVYSYSGKLCLGIVTDFQEFAIYDTRLRPKATDKASVARIFYCTYEQYPEKWEEIAGIFSREAVLKGSFDKHAAATKGKRGTTEFDDDFLKDMELWRDLLARNLALRNSALTQRELNFAVQRILDRIVFLRIAEDRGIEPYGQLQALTAGPKIYPRLREIFERADFRYNSGLFHFATEKGRDEAPDRLTLGLELDDATLKEIVGALYWPKSPYAFAVIPADILGHIYEQFLGKVIHLTADHHARVEEKPEVRKAGGVYYTPTYIVDYIVRQTVGPLVAGKTPKQIEKLTVLDPACGSGSFLLGAYEFLLGWHLDYYVSHDPAAWAKRKNPPIYETAPNAHGIGQGSGNWQLTTAERKRILTANLYGVDIDSQAVEVTKLSLLLKVLEGEARELRGKQLDFHRVLPDLGNNVKCGNSLIGSDFYQQPNLPAFDDEARIKVNAFDWAHEFKSIMDAGGFDAVIGNPPYVNAWEFFAAQSEVRDFINDSAHYRTADRHWDLYVLFVERAWQLTRTDGRFAFIIPFSYAIQKYAILSRRLVLSKCTLESVADLRTVRVFGRVPVITIIPVVKKAAAPQRHQIIIRKPSSDSTTYDLRRIEDSHVVQNTDMLSQYETMLRLDLSPERIALIRRLEKRSLRLGELCHVNYGAQMSSKVKGAFGKDHVIRDRRESSACKPMISGRELYRYHINWDHRYVDYSLAPSMYGPRWPEFFELPKVMIRDITGTHRIEATYDQSGFYCDRTILCALRNCDVARWKPSDPRACEMSKAFSVAFLAGIIASKLQSFFYYLVLTGEGVRTGGGFHTYPETIRNFLVPTIDWLSKSDRAQHDALASHVERMLKLHVDLAAAKSPDAQTHLQREIAATDRAIDQLVYQLYDLTPGEIALVEQATAAPLQPPEAKETLSYKVLGALKERSAYFSYEEIQTAVREENLPLQDASLRVYLTEATKQGVIHDAGRGWYSRLSNPVALDPQPVAGLIRTVGKAFPLLDFTVWSTAQINPWMHHLLAQPVALLHADAETLESVGDVLRNQGWAVAVNPPPSVAAKAVRPGEKMVVLRPALSKATSGRRAPGAHRKNLW
jgi:hypothetical protein